MKPRSILGQILVPFAGLFAGFLLIGVYVGVAAAEQTRLGIEGNLARIARTLAEAPYPLTLPILEQLKGLSGAEFTLREGDRVLLATLPSGEQPPEYYYRQTIQFHPPSTNAGRELTIAYTRRSYREAIWQAVRPTLLAGGSLGLLLGGLGSYWSTRLVRRLGALRSAVGSLAAGQPLEHQATAYPDEIDQLQRTLAEVSVELIESRSASARYERQRLLQQFADGLAHQIRNHLTGAQLTLQLIEPELPTSQREGLAICLRELDAIDRTLRQLLAPAGVGSVVLVRLNLAESVRAAVESLGDRARHLGAELTHLASGAVTVRGDAAALAMVWQNLLVNALEAAGPGGRVRVAVESDGERATVRIVDTGPGPPAAIAEQLFQPLVSGKPGGLGMGLAVSKAIVGQHGGGIRWYRGEDGTAFEVTLPANRAEEPA